MSGGFVATDLLGVDVSRQKPDEVIWPGSAELCEAAYDAGRQHGRGELPWDEAERLHSIAGCFERASSELAQLRQQYLLINRNTLVELATAMAEKIVRHELSLDPVLLGGMIQGALGALVDDAPVTLALSPSDHETLAQGPLSELEQGVAEGGLSIEVDEALEPGDFRLSTERSEIDARVAELLEQLAEGLRGMAGMPEESE